MTIALFHICRLALDHIWEYFRTILYILKHHHDKLNLKKCNWLQYRCNCLGMDVAKGVAQLTHSKNDTFSICRDLIHGEIFACSFEFLDYIASFCPYTTWTLYPREISCQDSPNQEKCIKNMEWNWCRNYGLRSTKGYWKIKGGHRDRTYASKNRTIPKCLYQNILFQGWYRRGTSAIGLLMWLVRASLLEIARELFIDKHWH